MPAKDPREDAFLDAVGEIGAPLLALLAGFEQLARRLHPPALPALRSALGPLVERLEAAHAAFAGPILLEGLEAIGEALGASAGAASAAGRLFVDPAPPEQAIARVLASMRLHCEALARLFPLADVLPPVHRFFLEPAAQVLHPLPFPPAAPGRAVGLFQAAGGSDGRGGFSLYVPPLCAGDGPWPLVVALHGGSGRGSEFLWTWLREARSRGFLLMAPTSKRSTWSLGARDEDGPRLDGQIDWVAGRWPVDRARILLTGLSDGATYSMLHGIRDDAPWTALAPISGAFHPLGLAGGDLERMRGRRIHLVHGALDWMFPVQTAREAARVLEEAGADLCYRELADLSHTHPREENGHILEWFDPGLALPTPRDG